MPSTSKKQARMMAAVAHNPGFAKKVGIPQSVGKDFNEADKGRKFREGGSTMKESKAMAAAEMKALKKGNAPKSVMEHERKEHAEMGYKKGGKVETGHTGFGMKDDEKGGRKPPHHKAAEKNETKGKHFAKGGATHKPKAKKPMGGISPAGLAALAGPPPGAPPGPMGPGPGGPPGMGAPPGMKKGGHVITHHHHYAHGGHVAHHGDGIAQKGHTKGHVVKMASGGHVGGHRGDGIAQKGHTKGRVC